MQPGCNREIAFSRLSNALSVIGRPSMCEGDLSRRTEVTAKRGLCVRNNLLYSITAVFWSMWMRAFRCQSVPTANTMTFPLSADSSNRDLDQCPNARRNSTGSFCIAYVAKQSQFVNLRWSYGDIVYPGM